LIVTQPAGATASFAHWTACGVPSLPVQKASAYVWRVRTASAQQYVMSLFVTDAGG
jgi:hypothetical protein